MGGGVCGGLFSSFRSKYAGEHLWSKPTIFGSFSLALLLAVFYIIFKTKSTFGILSKILLNILFIKTPLVIISNKHIINKKLLSLQ